MQPELFFVVYRIFVVCRIYYQAVYILGIVLLYFWYILAD